jgi:hypothetical protein
VNEKLGLYCSGKNVQKRWFDKSEQRRIFGTKRRVTGVGQV